MSHNARLVVNAIALLAAACNAEPIGVDRCNIRLAVISPDPARLPGRSGRHPCSAVDAGPCLSTGRRPVCQFPMDE